MLTVAVVVALVLGFLGLLAGFLALVTLGRLRRGVGLLSRAAGGGRGSRESFVEAAARQAAAADRTSAELADFRRHVKAELDALRQAVRASAPQSGQLDRSEFDQALDHERAEVSQHLVDVRTRIDADLAAMRDHVEELRAEVTAQTHDERRRLAADHSAARDQLRAAADKVDKAVSRSLQRTGLVRYDAFDEFGGRLSFSLAVLDGHGDGITLTALAGRAETRIYAKPVRAGSSEADLSPEERQAIAAALSG